MIVADIYELSIVGVFDRGVPDKERIVLRVEQNVHMGQYGLMLGVKAASEAASPIRDNLLWFGDAVLLAGDWVFVYTGPGEPRSPQLPNTTERMFVVHWGKPQTVLQHPEIVPILFRVDAVQLPAERKALPSHTDQEV